MESVTASLAPLPEREPDYYARAIVLWPRLDPRFGRVRHDPRRMALLISRRTNLSLQAILALLGAPHEDAPTVRDH